LKKIFSSLEDDLLFFFLVCKSVRKIFLFSTNGKKRLGFWYFEGFFLKRALNFSGVLLDFRNEKKVK